MANTRKRPGKQTKGTRKKFKEAVKSVITDDESATDTESQNYSQMVAILKKDVTLTRQLHRVPYKLERIEGNYFELELRIQNLEMSSRFLKLQARLEFLEETIPNENRQPEDEDGPLRIQRF
jgi:hypothetical protein